MTTKELQKRIFDNKIKHGFNTTDVNKEFCLMYGEAAEAYGSWLKMKGDTGEELADVGIFLLSIAEMLGYDLGAEIEKKMVVNEKRKYKKLANGEMVKE